MSQFMNEPKNGVMTYWVLGKYLLIMEKNIENVSACSMANNSPSRLDATPNNDAIKKGATPTCILELGIYS